jgi:hypothetical protein
MSDVPMFNKTKQKGTAELQLACAQCPGALYPSSHAGRRFRAREGGPCDIFLSLTEPLLTPLTLLVFLHASACVRRFGATVCQQCPTKYFDYAHGRPGLGRQPVQLRELDGNVSSHPEYRRSCVVTKHSSVPSVLCRSIRVLANKSCAAHWSNQQSRLHRLCASMLPRKSRSFVLDG